MIPACPRADVAPAWPGAAVEVDERDASLAVLAADDSLSDPESVHPATAATIIAAIAMVQRLVECRFISTFSVALDYFVHVDFSVAF
ncbi:hypothetical protein ABM90_20560 [Rhodococcus erythropolis]|nr:hypothetical protein ABM90_20560 [Rhodococcus erythropolis]